MKPKKFFYILLGLFVLLMIIIFGAAAYGNTVLEKKSEKLVEQKALKKAADMQESSLVQAKKDIERYKELDQITRSVVPKDKDQAKTVREITKIAEESGIALKSVTFQSSTLGQANAATPSATPAQPGAPASPAPISQLKPVDGIPGVYSLEITITPQDNQGITYYQFLQFLEKLEGKRRTAHVDRISITPTDKGLNFSLTLKAYVKP